jgi:hypothetical protein
MGIWEGLATNSEMATVGCNYLNTRKNQRDAKVYGLDGYENSNMRSFSAEIWKYAGVQNISVGQSSISV